jgi:hypothetical protein
MIMPEAYTEPKALGPVARLLAAFRNRRAHKRHTRNARIFVFSKTRYLTVAILVDESEDGALMWFPSSRQVAKAAYALDHHTGVVRPLELAWQAGERGGFRYGERKQLDVFKPDRPVEHVRKFWARMAGPSFH